MPEFERRLDWKHFVSDEIFLYRHEAYISEVKIPCKLHAHSDCNRHCWVEFSLLLLSQENERRQVNLKEFHIRLNHLDSPRHLKENRHLLGLSEWKIVTHSTKMRHFYIPRNVVVRAKSEALHRGGCFASIWPSRARILLLRSGGCQQDQTRLQNNLEMIGFGPSLKPARPLQRKIVMGTMCKC